MYMKTRISRVADRIAAHLDAVRCTRVSTHPNPEKNKVDAKPIGPRSAKTNAILALRKPVARTTPVEDATKMMVNVENSRNSQDNRSMNITLWNKTQKRKLITLSHVSDPEQTKPENRTANMHFTCQFVRILGQVKWNPGVVSKQASVSLSLAKR
ncbi:hypothetical protein [Ruegeria arenilitoris]|uniref:hypothetical protein n=1 Tax=Ruegeria arenilitoris TaxID=1173585 RepID=UPI00148103F1|nr:hypothetical protein [Ruegeria arenilitoris]